MRILILSIAYWLAFGTSVVWAQWQLQVANAESVPELLAPYQQLSIHESEAEACQAVDQIIVELQQKGYFQAHFNQLSATDSIYRVKVYPGERFQWTRLQPGNLAPVLQAQSGYREELFLNRPFHYSEFKELVDNCLQYSENTGYPFASLRLKNITVENQEVSATLDYQSGPLIRFGELNIRGTDKVNPEFLEAYLGIQTGVIYSEKKVVQIISRLQLLPFLSVTGPVETRFQNEVADIYIPLSYQASSQVDGIVSFLPAEGEQGGLLLTGELNVLLRNLGRSGKMFSLNWQRLQVASQQLSIAYHHPNVARSPLGIGASFNLLKEDAIFLNQQANLTLSYLIGGSQQVSMFGDWRSSRLIGENTAATIENKVSLANFSVKGGGVAYTRQQVDQLLFPRRGYQFSINGRVGQKKASYWTSESMNTNQITSQSEVSLQWAGELSLTQYYMVGSVFGIYHRLWGGMLSDTQLLTNELYRLGGLKSLRGFVDNSFFTSQFALSSLELRWLLEPESTIPSYLFAFYDQAWLQTPYRDSYRTDHPLGVGAGISVSTKAGLFSLVYALGKSQNQILNFTSSKVHFGYISRF